MRTQTETTVVFDSQEYQTLNRIEPSIRVGFPTDEIEALVRRGTPAGRIKEAQRQWKGRHLASVCSRRVLYGADYIHDAFEELCHLIEVLAEQSTREYWEQALQPEQPAEVGEPVPAADVIESHQAGRVSLVAPGTDVCGMLAETRARMLSIAQDALPLLKEAVRRVGPRPTRLTPRDLMEEGA